jgi:ParB/RepB/Spo0J family partition protein
MTTAPLVPAVTAHASQMIPIDDLRPSLTNPRQTFDRDFLEELTASVALRGILEPLLVNRLEDTELEGYEIIGGEQRYRAALAAGLTHVPCVIFELSPEEVLETQVVENVLRRDMHAMEEAVAYQRIIDHNTAYRDLDALAARVGKHVTTVRKRLKLLDLAPVVQECFRRNEITEGHAEVIAKLPLESQAAALSACFETYHLLAATEEEAEQDETAPPRRLRAVRELEDWIRVHTRQPLTHLQSTLPELDAALAEQDTVGRRVVEISHMHRYDLPRDVDKKLLRGVLLAEQWRPAETGKRGAVCPSAVLGVVTHGPNVGQQLQVCVDSQGCRAHWPAPEKKPSAEEKESASARQQEEREARERAYQKQEADRNAWETFKPVAIDAVVEAAGATLSRPVFEALWNGLARNSFERQTPPPKIKPALFVGALIRAAAAAHCWNREELTDSIAGPLGVNLAALQKAHGAKARHRWPKRPPPGEEEGRQEGRQRAQGAPVGPSWHPPNRAPSSPRSSN